jgi:nucleoside-diphosphate-sugar epimerase
VTDPAAVAQALAGCEVVFHLAAHRAVLSSVEHPLETDRANIGGTLTVLVAARDAGVRRVVAASSSSVYGGSEILPTPEDAPLCPRSPYAVTKLAGEQYCRVFWELFGLETVALRFFNVYGRRQRPESRYAAVVPLFVAKLLGGEPPEVHGDGLQTRDFTFIGDAVAAGMLAAEAPADRCAGRAFNVSGGRAYSLLEMLDLLQTITRVSLTPVHTEPRAGDIRHSLADLRSIGDALGYEPAVGLRDGLGEVVAWFRDRRVGEVRAAPRSGPP